ncbi:MAG: Cache 3/Cache 2 fusion domain-containing protein [Deltaproteobacteria bacterium]|nr:Cache 3/Cache 2 fusion domain-containing protein [Deltaproteobacteria bacterium]
MKQVKLSTKLILGGIALVVIPQLIIGILTFRETSKSMALVFRQQTLNTAKSLAGLVQTYLAGELNLVKEISLGNTPIDVGTTVAKNGIENSSNEIKKLDRKLAHAMKEIGADYEAIFAVDLKGTVYSDSIGGGLKGASVAEEPYFKSVTNGRAAFVNVCRSKQNDGLTFTIAVPVYAQSKEVVGAIAGVLKTDAVNREILKIKNGQTGYAYMVDQTGTVISHKRDDLVLKVNIKNLKGMEQITARILAREEGIDPYTFEGIEKLAAFAQVPMTGWCIITNQTMTELMSSAYSIRDKILSIGGSFLLIVIFLVWWFARSITRPILSVVEGLHQSSEQVAVAANEVAKANQVLASATSEQAAALEESSASLEQMTAMTRQNSENANLADRTRSNAATALNQAHEAALETLKAMEAIRSSGEGIKAIIKTIDEIAFQTNMLALNAAVEAARAGEAGAGFAVVADEVRRLALKAAEATRNTNELIEQTVKNIQQGAVWAGKTRAEFEAVVEHNAQVGRLMHEIVTASNEQAKGIDQISGGITEMDKVVQQNAASAQQSASAAEELNSQAAHLNDFVLTLSTLVGMGNDSNDQDQPTGHDLRITRSRPAPAPLSLPPAVKRTRS